MRLKKNKTHQNDVFCFKAYFRFVSFTIYIGLFFVSKYVLDRYCPIIPIQNNWTPLTKKIIHAKLGQPDVGSPNISVFMIITIIIINAIRQNIIPAIELIASGAVEKAVIPSRA